MRLLLIEDNSRLAGFMAAGLDKAGFVVDQVGSAADGDACGCATRYDAIILDLGLPDADGLTFLAGLRERGDNTPVLVVTARDGLEDRVKGLDQGADDYLLKPFAMEELVARIRVLLRRPGHALGLLLTQGNVVFDTIVRETLVAEIPLTLTRRELDALEVLMRRAGRVVAKSVIEENLYPFGEEIASNAIEVLMHRLRKRLQAAGADVYIHTLRGVGYFLSTEAP